MSFKLITYGKPAKIKHRKVFDRLNGVWKAEILKDGEVVREYENRDEMALDFQIADDIQQMRAIERMKYLE
jgi:hypothetical protein